MEPAAARSRFAELMARPDAVVDLGEGALLIAAAEYPDLDTAAYLAQLDELGRQARGRLQGVETASAVDRLCRFLVDEAGFRGNTDDYYDPRNSFLNDVLDRRLGIPITLSAVFIEVGRRAGLAVEGVGLPGHFIVRVQDSGGSHLVDPFHDGARLDGDDCQERLDRIFEGRLQVDESMLQATPTKGILARMLRNLKAIYSRREDHLRALRTVEMLIEMQPEAAEELRDRGMLYAALDCYTLAARDLAAYLERVPRTPEASRILHTIGEMRRLEARLN
ncbi:MAG TPA: tetratricopeptide repeat protein [Vicinamibacteria bacterium]